MLQASTALDLAKRICGTGRGRLDEELWPLDSRAGSTVG